MKYIQLVASDIDGTLLLNGAKALDSEIFKLIRELHKKGILFMAASGREYTNLRNLFAPVADEKEEVEDKKFEIVRTKRLSLKPMDSEEAVLQMDMLGHDFFIYEDAENGGIYIVYRRRDGRYGLIEASED